MALITRPELTKLQNDYLVKSNTESDDVIKGSKIKLFKNTSYDKHRSKRIHAEIVSVPYKLPHKRIHQEDYLFPVPKGYYPSENIERHAKIQEMRFGRKLTVKEEKKLRSRYSSGHYEPVFTCIDDQPIIGYRGDTLYFHYLALGDESYMGQDHAHNRYYRVPYESAFCVIHKGITIMLNGYAQVEPYWNEEYQELEVDGKIVRGKLKGDLVVGLAEAPEFRTGVVRHIGPSYGNDTRDTVKVRDIVLYSVGSEFKNKIRDREVYVMRQWNIIAKRKGDTFRPVGDYVHLRVRPKQGIILSLKEALEPDAEVIAKGENCAYVEVGDKVLFNTSAQFWNIRNTIFVREGHIMARYGH